MRYSSISSAVLTAYAFLTTTVQAQTFSSCNPLYKTCSANTALPATQDTDFAGAASLPSGWSTVNGALTYDSNGANFIVAKQGDSPTIQTSGYFLFGYCEVKMKAASGQGIVTSIVLESDDLDEVDWELIGTNTAQVQTNYFGKGDTTTYDRSIWHSVATPQTTWHTYAINWTSTSLTWLIDGVVIRTLNYADAQGGARYPQTPMRLKLGIWAGGDPSNSEGTITWAGGKTDFSQAPFTMSVASVKVVNYAPATSYTYGDNTGSWQSIKIAGGSYDPSSGSVSVSSSSAAVSLSSATTLATSVIPSSSNAVEISTASSSASTPTADVITTSSRPVVLLKNATLTSTLSDQTVSRTGAIRAAATQTTNAAAVKGLPAGIIALTGVGSFFVL